MKTTESVVHPRHFSTFAFDDRSVAPFIRIRNVTPFVMPRQIITRVFWNLSYCAQRSLITKILIDRYENGIVGFEELGSNKLLAGDEGKDRKKSKFDLHRFCSRKEATR